MKVKVRGVVIAAAAVAAGVWASAASAAPLVNLVIEARPTGTALPFSNSVLAPVPGTTYDYEVLLSMPGAGTTNSNGGGKTITGLTYAPDSAAGDGVNNLKFDIFQNSADPVQVNLTPLTLNPTPAPKVTKDVSWAGGTGASGGTATVRSGTNNDIIGVRPVHAAGVQTGSEGWTAATGSTPEVVGVGTFTISSVAAGPLTGSSIQGRWTSGGAGGFKINGTGSTVFISSTTESSADPYVSFAPLTFTPEPTAIGLLGVGALGLLARRRR